VTDVHAGDIFVLYTDGITETMNLQNEEFGPERLNDVVKKFIDAGPEALIDRIMEIIRHFRGPKPPADDSTILILAVD
jgi:sigma-B regulation protein RsbU (phosphoserine phosphatase)